MEMDTSKKKLKLNHQKELNELHKKDPEFYQFLQVYSVFICSFV